MVLNSIENLLEKYENGETSIKEEQRLKDYFASDEVAPHLESYRVMFQYFASTKQELYTKDVPLKPKKKSYIYQWISVAAVVVLMLGIALPKVLGDDPLTVADLPKEEQIVYYQAQEALAMLGANFNKGVSSVNALGLVSENMNEGVSNIIMASDNFSKGVEQASHVNKLAKTTSKLIKNK